MAKSQIKYFGFLILIVCSLIFNPTAWSMGESPEVPLQIVTQNVQTISENYFTVTFETSKPVSGQIRFGTNYDFVNNHKLTSAQLILTEKMNHVIKIEGLSPQTSYRYQIILRDPKTNEKVESDYYLVTTL